MPCSKSACARVTNGGFSVQAQARKRSRLKPMTDPKLEVGEAAARAPRLEHADVLLIERELDELERRCADVNDPQPLMTRLWAGKAIQQLRAARAPREPLEPADGAITAPHDTHARVERGAGALLRCAWLDRRSGTHHALAAARSALPPLQMQETKEDARVAPFNPRVETTGSTAESSPGNATAAERTELHAPWCSRIGKPCECELKDWHSPDIKGER
jgi:hypothetical protein